MFYENSLNLKIEKKGRGCKLFVLGRIATKKEKLGRNKKENINVFCYHLLKFLLAKF